MTPPAGRLYWICQAAGWGSFLAYVLIAYLATSTVQSPWDIASIIFFNGVVCPVLTHRLRAPLPVDRWWLAGAEGEFALYRAGRRP